MAASHDTHLPALTPTAAYGWVTTAIFGLYYRLVPGTVPRLATVHLIVTSVANMVFPVGIGLAILGITPALAATGGVLEVIAMAIFGFTVWNHREALSL